MGKEAEVIEQALSLRLRGRQADLLGFVQGLGTFALDHGIEVNAGRTAGLLYDPNSPYLERWTARTSSRVTLEMMVTKKCFEKFGEEHSSPHDKWTLTRAWSPLAKHYTRVHYHNDLCDCPLRAFVEEPSVASSQIIGFEPTGFLVTLDMVKREVRHIPGIKSGIESPRLQQLLRYAKAIQPTAA